LCILKGISSDGTDYNLPTTLPTCSLLKRQTDSLFSRLHPYSLSTENQKLKDAVVTLGDKKRSLKVGIKRKNLISELETRFL